VVTFAFVCHGVLIVRIQAIVLLVLARIGEQFLFALAVDSTLWKVNSWTSQFADRFTFTVISGDISVSWILAYVSISFTFVGECPGTQSRADCANRQVLVGANHLFNATAIICIFEFVVAVIAVVLLQHAWIAECLLNAITVGTTNGLTNFIALNVGALFTFSRMDEIVLIVFVLAIIRRKRTSISECSNVSTWSSSTLRIIIEWTKGGTFRLFNAAAVICIFEFVVAVIAVVLLQHAWITECL
jgi:hypothetical protein